MRACPDCADGLDRLAANADDVSGYLMARELLCVHLAERHPDALPGPVEGCVNCAEWVLVLRDPTGPAAAGGAGLAVVAAQHYAVHLLPVPRQ